MTVAVHPWPASRQPEKFENDEALFGRPVSEVIDDLKSDLFEVNNIAGVFAGGRMRLTVTKFGDDVLASAIRRIADEAYRNGARARTGD